MQIQKINHPAGNLKILIIKKLETFFEKTIFFFLSFILKLNYNEQQILISRNIYAPWKQDPNFLKIYNKIQNLTLLDIKRLYTLWNASLETKKKNGIILDIGCLLGGSGFLLSINNIYETFLIDSFKGCLVENNFYKKNNFKFSNINLLKDNIKKFKLKKIIILKGIFPNEFKKKFKNSKIKLCHIDVNTYKSTKDSFLFIRKKIIKGGYIIFDDYGTYGAKSIIKVVDEIKKKYQSEFFFINNFFGQYILIKK